MKTQVKKEKRDRRRKKIRAKVFGTADRPRLSIFKSNRYISLQIVDDEKGHTLAHSSTKDLKGKSKDKPFEAGRDLALRARGKGVSKVVFDRGGYIYTGSVKKAAEGAREGGLKF